VNVAIITARAGSKSIRNKNVMLLAGKPLVYYPIRAAQSAERISKTYISTDSPEVMQVGRENGCEIIVRPEELRGDHVNHGDVIKHAVEYADSREKDMRNVALLLGNAVMLDGELLDRALGMLDDRPDLDSVMSVWEAADDHPLRSLEIVDGLLRPYGDPNRQASTERQSYPKAYYYDQGVWAFRKECVRRRDGPSPWWWMGKRSAPIVRNWVTGRDIHTLLDAGISEWWLARYPDVKEL
jgi:CMP-N-acetylneuraminic acid synthetase